MTNENNEVEVRKKEQLFRGKSLEELKALDVREFAKLLSSNRKRNVLRNFQEHEKFLSLVNEKLSKGKKSVRTHKRELIILPGLVGIKLQIYNGRDFSPVDISFEMIGHKLGEFSPTRSKTKHSKDEKSKKTAKVKK
ncbi:30S ribosomal protein S19 [Candidatus Pacearchaeota archaeon CG_4_9_14_0_2_um_filter_30_8]|nr:MAG: 30S ribosomal protein S19 [Candidatus Pacearchaeota archaeon CG_4_9_14_0_2_um_filter_30_8]